MTMKRTAVQTLSREGTRIPSHSGGEANRLFLNHGALRFSELGAVMGLDSRSDGRSFARLDFDRDGFTDIALVGSNTPLLQLFRNRVGSWLGPPRMNPGGHHFIAIRVVGSHHDSTPIEVLGERSPDASSWAAASNRDGIGSRILVKTRGSVIARRVRAGEGFAAQNSSTVLVGLGVATKASAVEITFPAGWVRQVRNVEHGSIVVVYEDAAHSPTGIHWEVARYLPRNF
jgi:hypothetical protein